MSRVNWKEKKAQIPNRVQISTKVFYEICWIDSFVDPNVMGETRYDTKQIILKTGQSNKECVHTYLHEVDHARSFEYKVNLTENQVRALERSVYYVLKPGNLFKNV